MEKDIDEVGKIARSVKTKLEAINKDVNHLSFKFSRTWVGLFLNFCIDALIFIQNLANRQKPGCEKGTGVDRARTNMTKFTMMHF